MFYFTVLKKYIVKTKILSHIKYIEIFNLTVGRLEIKERKKIMVYGYCRISTNKQSIDRQIRNIKEKHPTAVIVKEIFTGAKQDRPEWNKLYKRVKKDDLIVFDEVSRMSRNAEEGFQTYKDLFNKDIKLEFLKESHINTESYKDAIKKSISLEVSSGDNATDILVNNIMNAINEFMMNKVESDIYSAFADAQKELDYLHQRTREGIETARLNGKQIGGVKGRKLNIKKKEPIKEQIKLKSQDFNGTYSDMDLIKVLGIARNTFYKYKKELKEEIAI